MRLRIVSINGTSGGVRVEDADTGEPVEDVVAVQWRAEVGDICRVTLELNAHEPIDVTGEAPDRIGFREMSPRLGPGKLAGWSLLGFSELDDAVTVRSVTAFHAARWRLLLGAHRVRACGFEPYMGFRSTLAVHYGPWEPRLLDVAPAPKEEGSMVGLAILSFLACANAVLIGAAILVAAVLPW